ncbi:MAG: Holliday junction branch migration protein RuvA [Bacteroidia bacterium]|nr:Holliday junction branch migration protein RuvA [Bacteroidia bacterium]
MYEFIEGLVEQVNPAFVIINANGVGWHIQISVNSYEAIKNLKQARLLTHFAVKEDGQYLYGFAEDAERSLFRLLISVNGVGTGMARMILSSQAPNEIVSAILHGNIVLLRSIKGVGPKTAQRIILELQDKAGKIGATADTGMPASGNKQIDEALLALQALGFQRAVAEKALLKITNNNKVQMTVEEMIKGALKAL